jgi:hypothetical protein
MISLQHPLRVLPASKTSPTGIHGDFGGSVIITTTDSGEEILPTATKMSISAYSAYSQMDDLYLHPEAEELLIYGLEGENDNMLVASFEERLVGWRNNGKRQIRVLIIYPGPGWI